MGKYFIWLVFGFFSIQAVSGQVMQYNAGELVKVTDKSDIQGSPYYNEVWAFTDILLRSGRKLVDLPVRYDIYKDRLLFIKGGNTYAITDSVMEFNMKEVNENNTNICRFSSNFPAVSGLPPNTFFQVLAEGKLTLLKHYHVVLKTVGASGSGHYSSDEIEKSYERRITVFVFNRDTGSMTVLQGRGKEDMLRALMAEKENQVKGYLKSINQNLKTEAGMVKAVNYYNSLFQ